MNSSEDSVEWVGIGDVSGRSVRGLGAHSRLTNFRTPKGISINILTALEQRQTKELPRTIHIGVPWFIEILPSSIRMRAAEVLGRRISRHFAKRSLQYDASASSFGRLITLTKSDV